MTETWVESIATQLVAQNLGTVLNVGSSCMALVEFLSQTAVRRIILTEPDPAKVRTLQHQYGSNPAVTIVPAAISEAIGPVTLHRFNITQLSALRPASGLKKLFPGLLEADQIEVPAQTVETVLQMCDLDSSAEHVLILGAAGEEMAIIDALIALNALHLFDHVIAPLPSQSLYEKSANGVAILKQLGSAGFRITSQDMSDPDLPMACMRLDRHWLALVSECRQFAEAKDAAEEAQRGVEQDLADLRQTLEETQKKLSAQKETAVFGETYRHALRLELSKASGATQTRFPAALKLLSALDTQPTSDSKIFLAAPSFSLGSFKKAADNTAERAKSHIVLDVKSVPRSGLHYMKRQFAKILQEGYSFCEWYQEPGCCRRMPCVHFPSKTKSGHGGSLRMLKSHDFDNIDPIYPVTPGMQRLILTRDPIFTLTSQWILDLLYRNRDILEANDIRIQKIYYLHESEVLSRAYGLLDASQTVPGEEDVIAWLEKQKAYLLAFSEKWGAAAAHMPRTYIVPYDKTPLAIAQCLAPITTALSSEQRARLDTHIAQWKDNFKPRSDPFKGPTPYLTTLLQQYEPLFLDAAEFICKKDAGGLFGTSEVLAQSALSMNSGRL